MLGTDASKEMILAEIKKAVSGLHEAIQPLSDKEINRVPYEDSWTAAQLLRHVTKSTTAISRAMAAPAPAAERDPGERIADFQKTFLDFSTKLKSPDFIIPEEGRFEKEDVLASLHHSFLSLTEAAKTTKLNGLIKGLPIGDATKLELLHFVLYHTERHLHQLHKICDALKAAQVEE